MTGHPARRIRPRARAAAACALALACVAGFAPAVGAQSLEPQASSFTFTGRGWGHGLGMSQWGSKGFADQGHQADGILRHYYQGTSLGSRSGPSDAGRANSIRVGLFQGATDRRISGNGSFEFFEGSRWIARAGSGQTWRVRSRSDGRFELIKPDGSSHGVFGSTTTGLYVRFEPFGTILSLPDYGTRYKHGELELNVYSSGGNVLRGILTLDFEKYLYGLGEVPSSWPVETLKTQAIAGRTYALEKANRLGQHRSVCNCAVYASTVDQAYVGYSKEEGSAGARWVSAVDATRGQVVLSGGNPIQAFYSSSSGGHTEHNNLQWGGSAISYLRGVCDRGDFNRGDNPHSNWTVTMEESQVRSKLSNGDVNVGTIQRIDYIAPFGVSGRLIRVESPDRGGVKITGSSGTARLDGDRFRSLLGLKTNLLSPPLFGGIRLRWDALNCAPGRPTSGEFGWNLLNGTNWGQAQNFEGGRLFWDKRNGDVFWNWGGILGKYDQIRAAGIDVGGPTSDEHAVRGGRAVNYQHGRIYWPGGSSSFVVYGGILKTYLSLGGPDSYLGLPLTDEAAAPGGGRMSRFQRGVLYWNRTRVQQLYGGMLGRWDQLEGRPGMPVSNEYRWNDLNGAYRGKVQDFSAAKGRLVWNKDNQKVFWNFGGILKKYLELRQANIDLRMPTSDEVAVRGGKATHFENGSIYWSSQTGSKAVYGAILQAYNREGGPDSRLRLPTSDEYSWNGGRRNDFQGGYIFWTPSQGASVHYS